MITPEMVMDEVARILGQPEVPIDGETNLSELMIDSLTVVEVVFGLEDKFKVDLTHEDLGDVKTLAELTALVLSRADNWRFGSTVSRLLGLTQAANDLPQRK